MDWMRAVESSDDLGHITAMKKTGGRVRWREEQEIQSVLNTIGF